MTPRCQPSRPEHPTHFCALIPESLEEAAWIDGCGVWRAFWLVTLPLAAPGLAATAVFCFIFSWSDFFYALILTRTNAMTAPVAIVNFLGGFKFGRKHRSHALIEVVDGKDVQTIVRGGAGAN
jgi:ABC-type glycerol-3-phosphate transport system permease component